jgi:hypothetical protein
LSQVIDRGAQAVARGTARCASQVLDRGARAVAAAPRRPLQFAEAGSAAMTSQKKNSNSADVQRDGFIPRGDVPDR